LSWGLGGALIACLCYGVATVFQAMGARRVAGSEGVDPRLLVRVLSSLPFLLGTAMDGCGLVFNLYALRQLPLFEVQGIVNTNLAVTAVFAGLLLQIRLGRRDKFAVAGVVGGLILLGLAAGPEGTGTFSGVGRWTLLGVSLLLAATALVLGNVYKRAHPALLGTVAGFLFGVFGIAVRILPSVQPAELVTDPAAYAALIASVTGFLFFTTALQRGSVNATAAALVVGETAVPALIGLTLLGDSARPGYGVVGVFGFLLAVGGALALARFAELPTPEDEDEGGGDAGGNGDGDGGDEAERGRTDRGTDTETGTADSDSGTDNDSEPHTVAPA
jgi:drug/metabolite transporter (DMT)-like permease